jgi:hypothetical protein
MTMQQPTPPGTAASGIPWKTPTSALAGGIAGAGLMTFIERASAIQLLVFGLFWGSGLLVGTVTAIGKAWSDGTLRHRREVEGCQDRESKAEARADANARGWMEALAVARTSANVAEGTIRVARNSETAAHAQAHPEKDG